MRKKLSDAYLDRANNYCKNHIGLSVIEDSSHDSDSWKQVSVQREINSRQNSDILQKFEEDIPMVI